MEGFQLWVSGGHRKVVEPIQCAAEHCTLGKDDQNLVILQGWSIAPVHARITRRADGLYVEDLGSRIGTLVNGSRIDQAYGPLQGSDEILIGAHRILGVYAQTAENSVYSVTQRKVYRTILTFVKTESECGCQIDVNTYTPWTRLTIENTLRRYGRNFRRFGLTSPACTATSLMHPTRRSGNGG